MRKLLLLTILICVNALGVHAESVKLEHDKNEQSHSKRSPIRVPDAYLEGHTLAFDASCIGSTLTLIQDGVTVYSTIIIEDEDGEGVVVVPDYLTGVCQLHLEIGSFTFVGEIEL